MPPIDPILSLALALQSNKGVYALLLGSGVSRAAKIPTGWEVVLDLCRKLAAMKKEDCEPDPAAWYTKTYGAEPDYAKLLDALTTTPSERQGLLKGYFEPTEEEREEGAKLPTAAHRSIAKLAATGHVRIIVTTNFDHLLEIALRDEGVEPVVISTPEAVQGALPLVHQRCCIVKVHGDYLDVRIKNTPAELSTYDAAVDALLDRIFDEFGLIICGWSGVWDTALRNAIDRCPTRRFSMYWVSRGAPAEEATQLIDRRCGHVLQIQDADKFFSELEEKVTALEESNWQHPVSVQVAVATLKRYVADDRLIVRLRDLVLDEAQRAFATLDDYNEKLMGQGIANQVPAVLLNYRNITETLRALVAEGGWWGYPSHAAFWPALVQNLARSGKAGERLAVQFRVYPALLLLYAGGVAAVLSSRHETLAQLLAKPVFRNPWQSPQPFLVGVPWTDLHRLVQMLPMFEQRPTAMSDHFFDVLQPEFIRYAPDKADFEAAFNRYEYLQALVTADQKYKDKQEVGDNWWGPIGRWARTDRHRDGEATLSKAIAEETRNQGNEWPLIQAGLFNGSINRFRVVQHNLEMFIAGLRF
jgi:hypothetical protein